MEILMEKRRRRKGYRLGNRFVGRLDGDTFRRTVKLSKHLYRRRDGWGVDLWLIVDLKRQGCLWAEFTEKEEGKLYRVPLFIFSINGVQVDHGHGVQIVLPRKFWYVKPLPRQLSLWET